MIKIGRIRSVVLNKALQDVSFFYLRSYIEDVMRDENGDFIDRIILYNRKEIPAFRLSLEDYCFNEQESEKLFELARKTIGGEKIDLKIISVVLL